MIVLDTQAAAWLVTRPQRLSRAVRGTISREQRRGGLAISSVTLMELAQRLAEGEIQPTGTPQDWLRGFLNETHVNCLGVSVDVAAVAAFLPPAFPSDPFDRLIAATAIVERAALVTSDRRIQRSGVVETIW